MGGGGGTPITDKSHDWGFWTLPLSWFKRSKRWTSWYRLAEETWNLRDKPYEELKGEPGHVDRLSQRKERILRWHTGLIHHLWDHFEGGYSAIFSYSSFQYFSEVDDAWAWDCAWTGRSSHETLIYFCLGLPNTSVYPWSWYCAQKKTKRCPGLVISVEKCFGPASQCAWAWLVRYESLIWFGGRLMHNYAHNYFPGGWA